MDLRKFEIDEGLRKEAIEHLDYQPFIIDNNHCTGVGYTWLHSADPRFHGLDFRYSRSKMPAEDYEKALGSATMLANTYNSIIDEACRACPGGSFLDISCNNGYFPIRAALNGMSHCAGIDPVDRAKSFSVLNRICRQKVEYIRGSYVFWQHVLKQSFKFKPRDLRFHNKWGDTFQNWREVYCHRFSAKKL